MKYGTLNVGGLRTSIKQNSVKHLIDEHKIDILFLQETHVDTLELGRKIERYFGGHIFWSLSNPAEKGTGIFISKQSQVNIVKFHHDIEGRLVYVDIDKGDEYRLINIYAHSSDAPARKQLFRDLFDVVNTSRVILFGGDFNCIPDPTIDKIGGNPVTGTCGWKELKEVIQIRGLNDVYRHFYPNTTKTTWKGANVACRLDRFYFDKKKIHLVKNITQEITFSDHELVLIEIEDINSDFGRGRGAWKFPNHLLEDNDFGHELYHYLINLRTKPDSTNISEWWDDLKFVAKHVSSEWCKMRKRADDSHYSELCSEYRQYEAEKNLIEMDRVKDILNSLEKERAKGAQIRSKAVILDSHEEPSSYFAKKEINQGKKKIIEEVEVDGVLKKKQQEIVQAFTDFYTQLYTAEDVEELTEEYLTDLPRIENNSDRNLGEPISLEEIEAALNQIENNKSPGPDGLTKEFYAKYFKFLGPFLVLVYKDIFQRGFLTDSMRLSYITLICKNENAPHLCKNYRPISLLNIDYKILTKVLSSRLRQYLPDLVHPDQTCAVKNRNIQDNCHYLRDIIADINDGNAYGALLSLDQEKAFDRVDHKYIITLLTHYGFNHNFLSWIKLLYLDINSSVIVNGHISPAFKITRSVRQGCPLSPLIYILALEPVLNRIRSDPTVVGCPIPGNRMNPPKLTAFADDCKFVVSTDESIRSILKHFDSFSKVSGSKLNKGKTELMYLGRGRNREESIENIKVVKSMSVFGIHYGQEQEIDNWTPVITKIQRKLYLFSFRKLSYFGKAKLCNVMILPTIWYLATIFPPNKDILKTIERIIFSFVWERKQDKINRQTMCLPVKEGGIGLVNIQCKYLALFLAQMMKIYLNVKTPWVNFGHMYLGLILRKYEGYTFTNNDHPHRLIIEPGFYMEIKNALGKISQAKPDFTLQSNYTSKTFYKLLMETKNVKPKCIDKDPNIDFKILFSQLEKSLIDPLALNLTFQMIHGVVPVADKLYKMGMRVGPDCRFCTYSRETIEHLFIHCANNHLAKHWLQRVCFDALGHAITANDIRFGPVDTTSGHSKIILMFISEYRLAVWVLRNRWRLNGRRQGIRDSLHMLKSRIENRLQADFIRLNQMIFERDWINTNLATRTDRGVQLRF